MILLRQHPDVLAAELQDLLAQLAAALVARLLHRVAQQHESPGQAEEQQQHAQLLRHVPAQESAQHGTDQPTPRQSHRRAELAAAASLGLKVNLLFPFTD